MRKSLLSVVLLGLGFGVGSSGMVFGAASIRGAKATSTIAQSATAVRLCKGPGVAYSITVSTDTSVQSFAVLRDSDTANTTSAIKVQAAPSTTLINQMTFDPPLQFRNGISFNAPAALLWATATYECGVVNNGY